MRVWGRRRHRLLCRVTTNVRSFALRTHAQQEQQHSTRRNICPVTHFTSLTNMRGLCSTREDRRNSLDEKKEDEKLSKKKKTMLCYDGYHQFDDGIGRGFGGRCTCYNDKRRLSEQKGASLWNIIKFYEKLWREKKEKNNLFIQSGGNWKNTRIYDTESRTRSMYVGR